MEVSNEESTSEMMVDERKEEKKVESEVVLSKILRNPCVFGLNKI